MEAGCSFQLPSSALAMRTEHKAHVHVHVHSLPMPALSPWFIIFTPALKDHGCMNTCQGMLMHICAAPTFPAPRSTKRVV